MDKTEQMGKAKPICFVPMLILWTVVFMPQTAANDRLPTEDNCPKFEPGVKTGIVENKLIREASGLAASKQNPGVLWVHNDAGGKARLFAISRTGRHLGIYNINGAKNRDWEDIAIGPGPEPGPDYIYIGDIGDNKAKYDSVRVYRIAEPVVHNNQKPVETELAGTAKITLIYPDGPRDAETLMVDPVTRDIYIVSKREFNCGLYRAAWPQSVKEPVELKFVGRVGRAGVVGGDISPAGDMVIIRDYFGARIWVRQGAGELAKVFGRPGCEAKVMFEPQGEAICFDAQGNGYFTVSEGLNQPVYYYARKTQ